MKRIAHEVTALLLLFLFVQGCGSGAPQADSAFSAVSQAKAATQTDSASTRNQDGVSSGPLSAARSSGKVIHVLVALCDNQFQGIVPVPARIGNGDDPKNNLYWGAGFGVRTFFSRSGDWRLVAQSAGAKTAVLERLVFRHRTKDAWLIADAYRGREIRQTVNDLFAFASGSAGEVVEINVDSKAVKLGAGSNADLIAFIGHNGLMDFALAEYPQRQDDKRRDVIVLCCISNSYFADPLKTAGASPLLLTTGLMAPEAYVLKAATDGWLNGESGESIRQRAAVAYHTYQKCGLRAARNLFVTGQ